MDAPVIAESHIWQNGAPETGLLRFFMCHVEACGTSVRLKGNTDQSGPGKPFYNVAKLSSRTA